MSDELFEVAFSGKIAEGAELEQVKAKVGAMFKADAAKLAQLFSGKRVVIKKNIDQAMANKYKAALNNAGAECEIKPLSMVAPPVETVNEPIAPVVHTVASAVTAADVPPAPQTAPLGINVNEIADLAATLAPVGSHMQDEYQPVAAANFDISGMDVAPAGSDLGQLKKEDEPPPPDIGGLSLEE